MFGQPDQQALTETSSKLIVVKQLKCWLQLIRTTVGYIYYS